MVQQSPAGNMLSIVIDRGKARPRKVPGPVAITALRMVLDRPRDARNPGTSPQISSRADTDTTALCAQARDQRIGKHGYFTGLAIVQVDIVQVRRINVQRNEVEAGVVADFVNIVVE